MDLKNITPYDKFRKIFEGTDEFSNKTGFAESLLGRGFFSIVRFFKKGINLGRLEYLKRKLENEYFAGWLRFCAQNTVNLKDGTVPEKPKDGDDPQPPEGGDPQKDDNAICEIFNYDWTQNNNLLSTSKNELLRYIEELKVSKEGSNPETDDKEIKAVDELIQDSENTIKYFDIKINIITSFKSLSTIANDDIGQNTDITLTDDKVVIVNDSLDKIIAFLNGDAKACASYHLIESEKNIINKINTCTNQTVKDKCTTLLALLTTESVDYDEYEVLNEEFVSSSLNTKIPIMQILGDSLNKMPDGSKGTTSHNVNPYEYLKSIGINSVDEINFEACANTWKKHPEFKEETTKLVSLDGVRKIQYAAARIIYKSKPSTTGHGEMAAGLDYTLDSDLRTAWERKVEKCKGEWRYFMNVDYDIDPFKQMSLQDAYRKSDASSDAFSDKMKRDTKPIAETAQMDKIGLKVISGAPKTEGSLYVIQYIPGNINETGYILCSLHTSNKVGGRERTFYVYLGNINVGKMINDKLHEKGENDIKTEAKNYAASILDTETIYNSKGCTEFNNYLKIPTAMISVTGKNIYNITLADIQFNRLTSRGTPFTNNTRMYFLYLTTTDQERRIKFGDAKPSINSTNASVKVFDSNVGNLVDCGTTGLKTAKQVKSQTGSIYQFKDNDWAKSYFPIIDELNLYQSKNKDYLKDKFFIDSNM